MTPEGDRWAMSIEIYRPGRVNDNLTRRGVAGCARARGPDVEPSSPAKVEPRMTTTIYPSLASAIAHSVHTAVAPLTWNPVEHLLARTTFGATPSDRAYVTRYGPDAFYNLQV